MAVGLITCPACGKGHAQVMTSETYVTVLICPVISDLIYVRCVAPKEIRERIKKELMYGQ